LRLRAKPNRLLRMGRRLDVGFRRTERRRPRYQFLLN
jgi:hypothetical protein